MAMRIKCPECGRLAEWSRDNPFRPFCSERCKMVDLGEWATGNRYIPGEQMTPEEEAEEPGQESH